MGSIRLLVMKSAPRFDPPVTHKNGHVSNTHIYFALSHFCRPFCTYSSHFFTSMASDVSERPVTENFGGNLRTFWTKLRKHLADNTHTPLTLSRVHSSWTLVHYPVFIIKDII